MREFLGGDGNFVVYTHNPSYRVRNLREHDSLAILGYQDDTAGDNGDTIAADHHPDSSSGEVGRHLEAGRTAVDNQRNFPPGDIAVDTADPVYEIPNPFAFRGVTYICKSWAEKKAADPGGIRLVPPPAVSLRETLGHLTARQDRDQTAPPPLAEHLPALLPRPLQLSLAASSTDPADLTALAAVSCEFIMGADHTPIGLRYHADGGRPLIHDHDLFETVANNPHLPASYQRVMVLVPGAQGGSEIVGEYGAPGEATHIYEYLRSNSYIPWGHYAANMAEDTVRYRIHDLTLEDMTGLRHLYYQRTFVRLAQMLELPAKWRRTGLSSAELEQLRQEVLAVFKEVEPGRLPFTATLWGWNFGYDSSGSGFRLHASHQQIHQQYALVPPPPAFSSGDQVSGCCREFRRRHGRGLFAAYLEALRHNRRIDGRPDAPGQLIIHEDEQVILFVPKAQVSQWELQIMTKGEVGNILEADPDCRAALDRALLLAQRILAELGATLVTSIEYSKRLDDPDRDQRLFYSLLPKLPYAMGAFTEAQQRWICGHFPEDFAAACRQAGGSLQPS